MRAFNFIFQWVCAVMAVACLVMAWGWFANGQLGLGLVHIAITFTNFHCAYTCSEWRPERKIQS